MSEHRLLLRKGPRKVAVVAEAGSEKPRVVESRQDTLPSGSAS